jgi:hypothetical protein
MPYLKNLTTGEVYPMNEHLLRRGDFVEVETLDTPAPAVEEVTISVPEPKAKRAPRKKAEVVPEAPPIEDEDVGTDDIPDVDVDLGDLADDLD